MTSPVTVSAWAAPAKPKVNVNPRATIVDLVITVPPLSDFDPAALTTRTVRENEGKHRGKRADTPPPAVPWVCAPEFG
jgi:hypothetical protein